MPDRESVITHLQIIHTWAEFARERNLQFLTAKHLEDIAQWADDAIALLKEDPRPSYQNDPERIYGFPYAGFEVQFTVDGGVLTVRGIDKIR